MARMNWVRSGCQVIGVIGLLALAGCAPGYGPAGVSIVVRRPPPERVEVVGTAPGSGYVWIRGHYAWQNDDYVWITGQWNRPPQANYRRWNPGHWAKARGGWYWVEGQWR